MHSGLKSWKNLLVFVFSYFSTPLLLRTLFSPYKQDKASDDANLDFLEKFVFAIFSRILGFIPRIILIAFGIALSLVVVVLFPIFALVPFKIEASSLENLGSIGSSLSYGNTFILNKYGKDLVSPYSFKIFGKEKALRMIERGLEKDTNHNVLLVGGSGVGKTSLIEYLGRLGLSGLSFRGIRYKRVIGLNLEGLDLNDFDKCLREASKAGNIIIAIENIHLYTTSFEKITPFLQAKNIGIVATTDLSNYDQVLKNYPEFLSRFAKVDVLPTNKEETLAILQNTVKLSGIRIEKEAIEEIVRLADRFMVNVPEPSKSLSILEELETLERKIKIEDVRAVISDKTNMPINSLDADERDILINLEGVMKAKIIGQDEAVGDVAEAMRRLRSGISDPSKPAGSFLFIGPTGVGKTYTAKILAKSYFGRKDSMVRFDMSEFSLPQSTEIFVARLGAIMDDNPLSLVFFDELEKSNRAVQNLLLQVLDEGVLTRDNGRIVSFKNAIIIATSNAGSGKIMENPSINKNSLIEEFVRDNIFAPEFLNRWSGIILFRPLDRDKAKIITKLLLEEFSERLFADKKIKFEITDALVEKIVSSGFNQEFGARPLKREIEELVENQVADAILKGEVVDGVIKIV